MRVSWLGLPLLLYLGLDFANPLVPGAVSFVAGAVHVVEAGRSGPPTAPVVDAPLPVRLRLEVAPPARSSELRPRGPRERWVVWATARRPAALPSVVPSVEED